MTEIIPRKDTVKWLHIVLEHKTQDLKNLAEEISVLNHQINHFNNMSGGVQDNVIDDLNILIKNYKNNPATTCNWDYKVGDI